MTEKPEQVNNNKLKNFLIDAFFILIIFGCLFLYSCRAIWFNGGLFSKGIGILIVLAISTVIYYLLKKRDSIYRR